MPDEPPPDAPDARAVARLQARLARAPGAPWLHEEVARRMAERLPMFRQPPRRWLDWSGFLGGGRTLVEATWPQAACTVVEPDAALLARSREGVRGPWWKAGRARLPVKAPHELAAGEAGLVWANMALHLEADAPALLARWHAALAVDGLLMFSTLGPGSLGALRALYAEAGWPAPHAPYADMHDVGDALVRAGFGDPVMDQETLRLHWSGPEALLADLRAWGQNLSAARFAGLRTPRWKQRLADALRARADADGRIGLTLEIVYGHALKPAPRPARDGTQRIALDELRSSLAARRRAGGDR